MRARQLARDRTLWIIIFANPGVVLGITWNMSLKPGAAGAIAAVLAGYAVGAAAALPLTKQPRRPADRDRHQRLVVSDKNPYTGLSWIWQ